MLHVETYLEEEDPYCVQHDEDCKPNPTHIDVGRSFVQVGLRFLIYPGEESTVCCIGRPVLAREAVHARASELYSSLKGLINLQMFGTSPMAKQNATQTRS